MEDQFIIAGLVLFLYFLPAFAARGKGKFSGVFVVNLFFGWTLIGWVIALAWGITPEKA